MLSVSLSLKKSKIFFFVSIVLKLFSFKIILKGKPFSSFEYEFFNIFWSKLKTTRKIFKIIKVVPKIKTTFLLKPEGIFVTF